MLPRGTDHRCLQHGSGFSAYDERIISGFASYVRAHEADPMPSHDSRNGRPWFGELTNLGANVRVVALTPIEAPENPLERRVRISIAAIDDRMAVVAIAPKDDHVVQLSRLNLLVE